MQTSLMEQVLSKVILESFCGFFTRVLELARQYRLEDITLPVYIAVITRRCYVLFFAYYELLCRYAENPDCSCPDAWRDFDEDTLKEYIEIFKECVITDNAASAMAYEIAFDYLKGCEKDGVGRFPHLIVVDELLFHGRSLNSFLFGFEKRLEQAEKLYRIKSGTLHFKTGVSLDAYYNNLDILVANWKSGDNALLDRYQKIFYKSSRGGALSVDEWRERSMAYAQYVSVCGVNNVGFTLSFAVSIESAIPKDNGPQKLSKDGIQFTEVCTNLQNIQQDTYLYFYPNIEQPRIVCSVRHKKSLTEPKRDMYVPYIIVDNISWEQIVQLHNELIRDARRCEKNQIANLLDLYDPINLSTVAADSAASQEEIRSLIVPWLTQTVDLVLTSWLMKSFLKQVKGFNDAEILEFGNKYIEWGQLIGNFRSYSSEDKTQIDTFSALKELWEWDSDRSLEEYLGIYAHDAEAFRNSGRGVVLSSRDSELAEDSPLVMCLEDTIAQIASVAESKVYTWYESGVSFPDEVRTKWGGSHSVGSFLNALYDNCQNYSYIDISNIDLYSVMGTIIQAMDLGLIGMNAVFGCRPSNRWVSDKSRSWKVFTNMRAGEAALFLLPTRYHNLIAVLARIFEIRKTDFDKAKFDIDCFVNGLSGNDDSFEIQISDSIRMVAGQLKLSLSFAYKMLVLGRQINNELIYNIIDRRQSIDKQCKDIEINRKLRRGFEWSYLNP